MPSAYQFVIGYYAYFKNRWGYMQQQSKLTSSSLYMSISYESDLLMK